MKSGQAKLRGDGVKPRCAQSMTETLPPSCMPMTDTIKPDLASDRAGDAGPKQLTSEAGVAGSGLARDLRGTLEPGRHAPKADITESALAAATAEAEEPMRARACEESGGSE